MAIFTGFCFFAPAQKKTADTSYIKPFEKRNTIELYTGISSAALNFNDPGERLQDFRMVANSSAYTGVFLNYKWLSLDYSVAIPGTRRAKDIKLKYKSFAFNFSWKRWKFHPFYNSYNGLLIPKDKFNSGFEAFRNIQYSNAGLDLFYYTNIARFSPGAANAFSQRQIKSAGSLFFMATPVWQKINWKDPSRTLISDSGTYTLLSGDPQWVSLIARTGYLYNFSMKKGKWNIVPSVMLGAGALREIETGKKELQLVSDIQASVNFGYNSASFYVYGRAWWDNLQTNFLIKSMNRVNSNFSITAGYRFADYRKKFLKIL
nr:DUF4421 family protein [Ferruginibacter sp. HRS2-29]